MQYTQPRIFHLASTHLIQPGVQAYLADIGVSNWDTNAQSDGEKLIEIAGKGCYKSFSVDLNPNLTKVRENRNLEYIQEGIVGVAHGSVLEHVVDSFALVDVSRILTHELVRHRIAGYSQESLRFVRLTALKAYYPSVFKEPFLKRIYSKLRGPIVGPQYAAATAEKVEQIFKETFEYLEDRQLELANLLCLDELEAFSEKKKLTSAMRRLAPDGLATAVMMTTNLRQWRLIIEKRTSPHAEEEIRLTTFRIFQILSERYPAVFADATVISDEDGFSSVVFKTQC